MGSCSIPKLQAALEAEGLTFRKPINKANKKPGITKQPEPTRHQIQIMSLS